MRRLIDQNLNAARATRASALLSETVPVRPVIEDLVFAFSHVFRERGLSVAIDIPADITFRGSRDDLQEMLGNLLENAHAWARSRIRVKGSCMAGNRLTVCIEDDGPGFPVELLATISNAHPSPDPDVQPTHGIRGSTGLGLVITQEIAAQLRGRLELANAVGGGAIATLSLPSS
jgi:signal transduction histidine kinase